MRTSPTAVAIPLLVGFVVGCSQVGSPVNPSPSRPPAVASGVPSSNGESFGVMGATGIRARVIAVEFTPTDSWVTAVIVIPRSIHAAAREKGAPFGIQTSVAYHSVNNTDETVNSGPKSIGIDTLSRGPLTSTTDVIELRVPFGTLPAPSNDPDFNGTATIVTMH